MKFTIYTLPFCGICHMIKDKLESKHIQYEEEDFTSIAEYLQTDHAPALKITDGNKVVPWHNNKCK